MHIEDHGVPRGTTEDARLESNTSTQGAVHASSAILPPSECAPAGPYGAPEASTQSPADAPELSPTSNGFGAIERMDQVAFFDRIEKVSNLEQRAFLLRCSRFKPYDERSRGLIASVADAGLVGAIVQHLLHTPPPMPASIMKPMRLPRPPRLKRVKPPKSLIESLLGEDDAAA
ncbi:hypothetical protein [Methylobacterium indicum]|uniref:Uncharacterized protein n=1 Tax=Methylobacterium indicum TaxID=1775910 RepID=A0A8H9C8Q8_9HYPH|nr:hypothetical protein [Methylobacterium indicum]BCM86328.1 hypothetical protein mvi_47890 [Methylobacterium indicum]